MTPEMIALLKVQEKYEQFPYHDTTGNLTGAYGRNLDTVGISESEACIMLDNDIAKAEAALAPYSWFAKADPVRRDVLVNMAFNMGMDKLLGFHLMIAALQGGNYRAAALQMSNSLWARQVGTRATTLAQIMATGIIPAV